MSRVSACMYVIDNCENPFLRAGRGQAETFNVLYLIQK